MIWTAFPFLLLAWLFARRGFLRANIGETLALTFPMALALFLIGTGLGGRLSHRFSSGILFGSLAALGVYLTLRFFHRSPQAAWKYLPWNRWKLLWLLSATAVTALVALVSWRLAIFDEMALQGHLPVVESMLRDHFPPSYSAFPEVPYRYHYGFNMLAAYASWIAGVPGYLGIDLAALASWLALACMLPVFLRRFGVPDRGLALGFILVTLTGGLSWLLLYDSAHSDPRLHAPFWQSMMVYRRMLHPHFMMYFFQHPMGSGMPLFLAAVLAFDEWFEARNRWALMMGILLLGALSLTQVVLFVTLLASLGLIFGYRCLFRSQDRPWFSGMAIGGLGLALAFGLGGFFSFSPHYENQPLLFSWPPGYLRWEYFGSRFNVTAGQALLWYLSGFGLFLFLIPMAWVQLFWKRRTSLSVLAIFGFLSCLIPQFFRYSYSWDIIKWLFAFEFSGKLLVAVGLLPWCLENRRRQVMAWLVVGISAVTPVVWLWELASKNPAELTRPQLRVAHLRQPRVSPELTPILETILSSPSPWGRLWASPGNSQALSHFTGLPTVHVDRNTQAMPVSRMLIARRKAETEKLEAAPDWEILRALGIRWIYFKCSELQGKAGLQEFLESMGESPMVRSYPALHEGRECFYFYRVSDQ